MQSNFVNEKLILVSENKTYQDLVFAIADVLKVKRPKTYARNIMTNFAWRLDWFLAIFFSKKRVLTKSLANSLHSQDFFSNKKIVTILDYKFEKIDGYLKLSNPE